MAQDFIGSIADEDIQFITQILKTTTLGENYWRLMIFIEESRFVADPTAFIQKPGTTFMIASVDANTYGDVTNGLLRSWLYDFYASGATSDVFLVQCGPDIAGDTGAFITSMEQAYDALKDYAYWKTVCAGGDDAISPDLAVALSLKCAEDADLLSAAPLFPATTESPEDMMTDPIYAALMNAGSVPDAIITEHQDATRNGSLFRLGQALAFINDSGTCVGNNMDYLATGMITPSGPLGTSLSKTVRNNLKNNLFIGFFKLVGDGTGNVAAVGVSTIRGNNIQAHWIVSYIDFMSKTMVARYITKPNRLRNATTYADIIDIMREYIGYFGGEGSGRLRDIVISAPSFGGLPPAKGDEIIVPNAWSAYYTDQVHTVKVYGTLYITA